MKTAIVIGATGLIGGLLTHKLLSDINYSKVKVFVRRPLLKSHPKLEIHLVNFDNLNEWRDKLIGDDLFSALGTTIKKAGSKQEQYKIDFTYQLEIAKAAAENGLKNYFLVSSLGANYKSSNFYLRMKGNLDERIQQLDFARIRIFRPSVIIGERDEKRLGEILAIKIAGVVIKLIPALKKYEPISAAVIAEAMIKSANQPSSEKIIIYESSQISKLLI